MGPTERIIDVLEYLAAAGREPVKQVDIVRDLGLSPATLNRIVRILSDRGYLFRTSEKYLIRNYSLRRTLTMSKRYLEELHQTTLRLTEQIGAAVEVIVVVGHELLWHSRTNHPNPNVAILAKSGFRRGLLEFDALSRLYLSTMDEELVEEEFDLIGFFDTGCGEEREIRWLNSDDVRKQINETRGKDFACDLVANHVGIRRFATVIKDPDGRFLHFLSIADQAPPGTGEGKFTTKYRAALLKERDHLTNYLSHERRSYEAASQQFRIPSH